jgi:uncharacterized protein YbjT (DUF2867 family)
VIQLVAAGHTVSVLSRQTPSSVTSLPSNVQVIQVDYDAPESLVSALQGHDAAVCAVTMAALPLARPIIDACIAAKVRRYVPGEYGSFTGDDNALEELPFMQGMRDARDYLAAQAGQGKIEYTHFATGSFLEAVLDYPLYVDFRARKASFYNLGNHPASVSRRSTVARAIVAAFSAERATATANRSIFVHDALVSQRQLVDIARRHGTSKGEWDVQCIDGAAEYAAALEGLRGDSIAQEAMPRALLAALLTGRFQGAYLSTDNAMLGLGYLGVDELEKMIAAKYQEWEAEGV